MRIAVVRSARAPRSALVQSTADALRDAGHLVAEKALGSGEPGDLEGVEAVVLLSPEHPGLHARASTWREWDRWHATTVPWLTSVARSAHVRRLVLQSSALVYADGAGDEVDERSALTVTPATEPWCAAETAATRYADGCRTSVVLRIAPVSDDPAVVPWLASAASRPGSCPQVRWQPGVSLTEAAEAFVRAISCPGGIYNVGSASSGPDGTVASRRVASRRVVIPAVHQLVPWQSRVGQQLEPYARSIRLTASRFGTVSGWHPTVPTVSRG